MKGHRIGELTRANTGAGVLLELASFSDLKRDELDIVGIKSPSAIFATVMEHNLDALLIVAPRGSAIIGEAIKALTSAFGAPPLLLALKETKAIATRIAALDEGEIAIGELSANPPLPAVASPTLTFPALLVARRQISDNSIRDLTKQIFDVRNSISALYPAASRLTSLDTERGGSFAVHPGAAIYYDASETSILERYSDMLWLLLFGFSTVVSAIVWFLRRLFPRQTELLREEHAELIELLQHVRATKSVADLDRAEKRIDEIVSGISKLSFRGMIDEEQQPAFELIISRIEKVIDDRRRSVEDLENQVSADPEK